MPVYKVHLNHIYEEDEWVEVEADNEKQAEEKALNTYINDWDDERFENGDALTVDEIEEVQE